MRKTLILLLALLFVTSCAGLFGGKAPNYSGKWIGPAYIDGQGDPDNWDLTLNHEGGTITGTLTDEAGYMSDVKLIKVEFKEKVLEFSFVASTPMGDVQCNCTGTFSEDNLEYSLTFEVPDMDMGGNAKLKKLVK